MIRSTESSALHVLRAIEDEAMRQKASQLNVFVSSEIALYILNHKRQYIQNIESTWGMELSFLVDNTIVPPDYRLERTQLRKAAVATAPLSLERVSVPEESVKETADISVTEVVAVTEDEGVSAPSSKSSRSRMRRRSRKGKGASASASTPELSFSEVQISEEVVAVAVNSSKDVAPDAPVSGNSAEEETPSPKKGRRRPSRKKTGEKEGGEPAAISGSPEEAQPTRPKAANEAGGARRGWWKRLME
jgi:ribonuclease E